MPKRRNQIVYIGGGDSFETDEAFYAYLRERTYNPTELPVQKWRDWLRTETEREYDFLRIEMPNTYNADYAAWEIWFEKVIPYLTDGKLVMIGHSLGASFLLKYLEPISI